MGNDDFAELATRIDRVESKLTDEITRIESNFAIATRIQAADDKLSLFEKLRDSDSKSFDKQLSLYADAVAKAEAHRQETRRDIFRIVTLGAAFATAVGLIGVTAVKSILNREVKKASSRVEQLIDYQFNYARGTGLLAANAFEDAIPYLDRCRQTRPYDRTVLIPLLNAIDMASDVDFGKRVIDQVRGNPAKYDTIQDPLALDNIAVVEIDVGAAYRDRNYLALARQALQKAQEMVREDDKETRRFIYQNLWSYRILTGDLPGAARCVDELFRINDKSIDTWERVRQYKMFEGYFNENPSIERAAGAMWKRLETDRNSKSGLRQSGRRSRRRARKT
jgi:tetratricopeptide (TPR) repeat protein